MRQFILSILLMQTCYAAPWWEAKSAKYKRVPADYSWKNRRTGISKKWTNGLAIWSHYRPHALSKASDVDLANTSHGELDKHEETKGRFPIPWTSGKMCKSLRQIRGNAFELCSVYEKEACGDWAKGRMIERSSLDTHMQHGHIFEKTPNRVTSLPFNLPDCDEATTELASASQVTIVEKNRATFSGPRWLPSQSQANLFRRNANTKPYFRMQFCEMWLAEELNGQPEGRKIGLFLWYDGLSGNLLQIFRMNEIQLKGSSKDPKTCAIDMNELEKSLEDNEAWTDSAIKLKGYASSPVGGHSKYATLSNSSLIPNVLHDMGFKYVRGRAVQTTDILTGASSATTMASPFCEYYFPEHKPEQYFSCQFEDGVFIRVPRKLTPDMKEIGMEIGCFTLDGDFQRLLAIGDREKGAMHTVVYERYYLVRSKLIK